VASVGVSKVCIKGLVSIGYGALEESVHACMLRVSMLMFYSISHGMKKKKEKSLSISTATSKKKRCPSVILQTKSSFSCHRHQNLSSTVQLMMSSE